MSGLWTQVFAWFRAREGEGPGGGGPRGEHGRFGEEDAFAALGDGDGGLALEVALTAEKRVGEVGGGGVPNAIGAIVEEGVRLALSNVEADREAQGLGLAPDRY